MIVPINKVIVFSLFFIIISCNKEESSNINNNVNEESSLIVSTAKALRNQEVIFNLIGESNVDYTEFATFYINGNIIEGNVFSSPIEGVFDVYAKYQFLTETITTNTETIEVFIPKKKVLIEDYTANWCGPCLRIATSIRLVKEQTEDVVVVAIHCNSNNTSTDPLANPVGFFLKNHFEVQGFPTGILNRNEVWEDPINEPFIISQALETAGVSVESSIGINSQIIDDNLNIDISIVSETTITSKKLVVFLLENGILLDQSNGYYNNQPESEWYQLGDPIVDYEHNEVLRESLTDPLGDSILNTIALKEYTTNYNTTIDPNYNVSNLSIVAMIVNEDGSVVNAQNAVVGENKPYE